MVEKKCLRKFSKLTMESKPVQKNSSVRANLHTLSKPEIILGQKWRIFVLFDLLGESSERWPKSPLRRFVKKIRLIFGRLAGLWSYLAADGAGECRRGPHSPSGAKLLLFPK